MNQSEQEAFDKILAAVVSGICALHLNTRLNIRELAKDAVEIAADIMVERGKFIRAVAMEKV